MMSTFKQMTTTPDDLLAVLSREIGLHTKCKPFATKAVAALKTLGQLTSEDARIAADTFLSNLQTLNQGGITAEDHDKIDFVKRGKAITISARVEAFYRAASRKGYRITDTIIAVPVEDGNTTYFKEHFHNGEIIYVAEDKRMQADREVTAERLISGYFSKFICRLEVVEIKSGRRLAMTVCEMSGAEMLAISNVSEQGLYKTKREEYINDYGQKRTRKVVTDELNPDTFWTKWTGEMVNKTIIRRALKRVKEVLPELNETIYAFENEPEETAPALPERQIDFEIPMTSDNVDMDKLNEQQQINVSETLELFMTNPKLADERAVEIKGLLDNGESLQSVINTYYASIINLKRSAKLWPMLSSYFEDGAPAAADGKLVCSVCGKEITSEKSKQYYAKNPGRTVKCYTCNQGGA